MQVNGEERNLGLQRNGQVQVLCQLFRRYVNDYILRLRPFNTRK
jgi:hypothetical protein